MKRKILNLSFLFVLMFALNVNAATHTFNIDFDNDIFDKELKELYVATGTFSFVHNDATLDGIYSVSDWESIVITFTDPDSSDSFTFTEGEIISNFGSSDNKVDLVFVNGQFITFQKALDTTEQIGGIFTFKDEETSSDFNEVILIFEDSVHNQYDMFNGGGTPQFAGNYGSTAVPIPAALWLFGSGIVGLALLRKRSF